MCFENKQANKSKEHNREHKNRPDNVSRNILPNGPLLRWQISSMENGKIFNNSVRKYELVYEKI